MSTTSKAKLLCNFGGEFSHQLGRLTYVGGKTRLVLVERSINFDDLRSKMSQLNSSSSSRVEFKFQLPDETIDSRLVSVECDDDVVVMMSEFEPSQRIPLYIFENAADSLTRENASPPVVPAAIHAPTSIHRENVIPIDLEEFVDAEDVLIPLPRVADDCPQASVNSQSSLVTNQLRFEGDNDNLAVGQEFPDAQAFRNALIETAISMKFELTFIRSDRARVTAKCAAAECSWRIHASKLPDVETFQVKTLKGEHSCIRPERSSHRQANMKWILNCIMDRVRENINYKPKDIMRDIEEEHGVIIPYLKAHRAKERALELIHGMPIKDIVLNQAETLGVENGIDDVTDRRRKKPLKGSPVHCNMCKKIGHNKRSCIKSLQNEMQPPSIKEKNFHCILCKQNGHNRRTCPNKVGQVLMNV